jgi:mannose-6-phosphate isomerase-like protein (cupin superfamily)
MKRTGKTWGQKNEIFRNDLCEVSVLYLKSWQRCSYHKHTSKFNLFFVNEGELYIKLDNGVSTEIHTVKEGGTFTTPPGQMHEFQTRENPAVITEVMYVEYDSEDIQREIIGGPLNEQKR